MNRLWCALALGAASLSASVADARASSPISIEIIGADGRTFREIPAQSRDGALRSWLQAEKGARYEVRVRNSSGERLGLVIAVDGRNIINGKRSELSRTEPMYVLDAWDQQAYSGWRTSLEVVNEFYFTDWKDSYAEAFGDSTARGVIAVAVYREVPPPQPVYQPYRENDDRRAGEGRSSASEPPASSGAATGDARGDAKSSERRQRDESAGTGYGDRRIDHAVRVEFTAQASPDSRHFIKYEWREALCRKQLVACGEQNRFWDESVLGFAPPPPGPR
jgi:hypothetical protein